ncbi:MAG: tetratricopeptide repeat protein [Acidobacteriota bacterium]|nr:tetratricopeptide repeat protein [Acidobacteriota bacterium]
MLRSARIAGMEGDVAAERAGIEAAVEAYPGSLAPVYALMEHYRRFPPSPEEEAQLLRLLAERLRDPENPVPLGILARMALDPDAEEETLELVVENLRRRTEAEGNVEYLQLLGGLEERLGNTEEAAAALQRLYDVEPSENLVVSLVELLQELERYGEAADLLKPYAEEDEGFAWLIRYARALGTAGRFEELMPALAAIDERLDALPPDQQGEWVESLRFGGYRRAAWAMRDAGRHEEAERLFRRMVELRPDSDEARSAIVFFYSDEAERQQQEQALADRWAGVTDPNDLLDEGIRRLAGGDSAGALELLRKAVPQFPKMEAAWYNLGIAAYQQEDWEMAAAALERAAALNDERVDTHLNRGIALFQAQRYEEAVEALNKVLELDPERATAHYYLGTAYKALGDDAASRRHLAAYREGQS